MLDFISAAPFRLILGPALAVFFFSGLLLFLGRGGTGPRIAAASLGVAFAWIATLNFGFPDFPPLAAEDAFAYILVFGLIFGIAIDLFAENHRRLVAVAEPVVLILYGIGAIAWVRNGLDSWSVLYILAWGYLSFRLQAVSVRDGRLAAAMVIMVSIGVAIVAWIADLAAERDIAFAMGGATIGLLIWNWIAPVIRFGTSAVLVSGGAILMLTIRIADPSPVFIPALVLIGFILFADQVAERVRVRPEFFHSSAQPFLLAGISLLPLLLAATAAFIGSRFPGP